MHDLALALAFEIAGGRIGDTVVGFANALELALAFILLMGSFSCAHFILRLVTISKPLAELNPLYPTKKLDSAAIPCLI